MPLAGELIRATTVDWAPYGAGGSAVLTASTTDPTQGNSTYVAEYLVVSEKLVKVRMRITIGATFAAGSGTYRLMAPPGYTMANYSAGLVMGISHLRDSGTAIRDATLYCDNAAYMFVYYQSAATEMIALTHAGPGTAWATNDYIVAGWDFEPA